MDFRWELVSAQSGGTVTSLVASPEFVRDHTFFAATMAGLYCSRDAGSTWQRVGTGFTGVALTAVVISPAFVRDNMILAASLEGGLFRITDGGSTWAPGDFRGRQVHISALALSPNFSSDGIAFTATMGDGIFRSHDQGASWDASNFGLLDLQVLALAISPAFDQDQTLFAATSTGVFRSQNGGRAWREAPLPAEVTSVQSLAVSPCFAVDGILFAGTDTTGMYRSTDHGKTWSLLNGALSGTCINAIAVSPAFPRDRILVAATDSAVYLSQNAGESWSHCVGIPGPLCLVMAPDFAQGALDCGPVLVGLSQRGVYRSTADLAGWHLASTGLHGRLLTGLSLSPAFATDRRMLAFGAGEGVLRSDDAGLTWAEVDDEPPSPRSTDLTDVVAPGVIIDLAPLSAPHAEQMLAATDRGVFMSLDGGVEWHLLDGEAPVRPIVALGASPDYARDRAVYALELGGALWRLTRT